MLILLRRIGEKPELKIGEDSPSGRLADATDPHYYAVGFKIVNFAPKVAEISLPAAGGKGIADAIKDKGGGKPALPPGLPPPGGG